MGIHFSDWVENIVGREEIARYEQFLLFPQYFQKLSVFDALNEYLWSKSYLASISGFGCKHGFTDSQTFYLETRWRSNLTL